MKAAVAAIVGFLVGLLCDLIPLLGGGAPLPSGLAAVVIALCPPILLVEWVNGFPHILPAFINAILYACIAFAFSKIEWPHSTSGGS